MQDAPLGEVDRDAEEVREVGPQTGEAGQRHAGGRVEFGDQVAVAVRPGLAAGNGAEDPKAGDAAPAEIGLALARAGENGCESGGLAILFGEEVFDETADQVLHGLAARRRDRLDAVADLRWQPNGEEGGAIHAVMKAQAHLCTQPNALA